MNGYNITAHTELVGLIITNSEEKKNEYFQHFSEGMKSFGYDGNLNVEPLGDMSGLKLDEGVYVISKTSGKMVLLKK